MKYASCISELVKISVCLVESWWCPGQCPRDALRVNKSAFRNLISHHTNHENQSHRNCTVISQITKRDRTDTVRTTGRNRTETVRTTDRHRTNHGPKPYEPRTANVRIAVRNRTRNHTELSKLFNNDEPNGHISQRSQYDIRTIFSSIVMSVAEVEAREAWGGFL